MPGVRSPVASVVFSVCTWLNNSLPLERRSKIVLVAWNRPILYGRPIPIPFLLVVARNGQIVRFSRFLRNFLGAKAPTSKLPSSILTLVPTLWLPPYVLSSALQDTITASCPSWAWMGATGKVSLVEGTPTKGLYCEDCLSHAGINRQTWSRWRLRHKKNYSGSRNDQVGEGYTTSCLFALALANLRSASKPTKHPLHSVSFNL